jgi:hypothetical protein
MLTHLFTIKQLQEIEEDEMDVDQELEGSATCS